MMGDPIPGPYRGSNNPSSYREMEVLMKEYDLDVPLRIVYVCRRAEARNKVRPGSAGFQLQVDKHLARAV